jgi:hypothetical protein
MANVTATHQKLQSILAKPGCPICALSQQAVNTYLDTLLWESSTDLNVFELLSESLGLCGRHSRQLLEFGGQRLAAAVIERTALLAAIRRLPELASPPPEPEPSRLRFWPALLGTRQQPVGPPTLPDTIKPCLACVRQWDEEGRAIVILLAHLHEFSGPLLAAGGLCLPHFIQAARTAGPRERAQLLSIQQQVWNELYGHLEEFIREHKFHSHTEPISEQGRLAVERTIAALTGEYPAR